MVIRVLLVDDHELIREVLSYVLSGQGDLQIVGEAPDAANALSLAQEVRPDVVVMDVDLPGTDGIAATRTLLGLVPTVRVVMLSAMCSPSLVRDALDAGACGYLMKGDATHFPTEGVRDAARGGHPMTAVAAAMRS